MLSTNIWSLVFTVINLLILFWLLKKFLFGRIDKIIEKREAAIQKRFSEADRVRKEAEVLKQKYKELISSSGGDNAGKLANTGESDRNAE